MGVAVTAARGGTAFLLIATTAGLSGDVTTDGVTAAAAGSSSDGFIVGGVTRSATAAGAALLTVLSVSLVGAAGNDATMGTDCCNSSLETAVNSGAVIATHAAAAVEAPATAATSSECFIGFTDIACSEGATDGRVGGRTTIAWTAASTGGSLGISAVDSVVVAVFV